MVEVTIVNSFFIFNKIIDQFVICSFFNLIAFLILNSKLKYLVLTVTIAALAFSFLENSLFYLDVVTISSLPVILFVLVLGNIYNISIISTKKISLSLFFNFFNGFLIIASIYSLFISSLKILGIIDLQTFPRDYFYDIFVLFNRLVPYMMVLLSFSLLTKFLLYEFRKRYRKISSLDLESLSQMLNKNRNNNNIKRSNNNSDSDSKDGESNRNFGIHSINWGHFLILSIILSFIIPIIPQTPFINPENRYVGVDTFWYVDWTRSFGNATFSEILENAFVKERHGDRPLSLLVVYPYSQITPQTPGDTIDYLPIVLTPLLTVLVYFLTMQITKSKPISSLAAFFSIFSFQTIIGIYAGFYANWIGLIISFLMLIFLFKFLEYNSKKHLVLYSLNIGLLVFFHAYTWAVFTTVTLLLLLLTFVWKLYNRKTIIIALIILGVTVSIDVSKDFILGSSGGVKENIQLVGEYTSLNNILKFDENLFNTGLITHGGIFGNGVIFLFVLIWSFLISKLKKPTDLFFLISFSIVSVLFFVGSYVAQIRVLYDIPFQIPFAIAVFYTFKKSNNPLILFAVIFILGSISVRDLTNFYYIPQ
jgi:hypothetical protein